MVINRRVARREGVRKWQARGEEMAPGLPHDTYDPEMGKVARLEVPADVEWWAGIASTPSDKRSALVVARGPFARTSWRLDALPELLSQLPEAPGEPAGDAEPGEHVAVLGPDAVAALVRETAHEPLPGGETPDLEALVASVEQGVYVAAPGIGRRITDGTLGDWIRIGAFRDPHGALASVQARTREQWAIPHGDDPLTVEATWCPAIRVAKLVL